MNLLKLTAVAFLSGSIASAAAVPPFPSDGCTPGFTAKGEFVDETGKVLDGKDWTATADKQVLTSAGKRVLLKKSCLGLLAGGDFDIIALLAGVAIIGLSAGGTSSTSSTND